MLYVHFEYFYLDHDHFQTLLSSFKQIAKMDKDPKTITVHYHILIVSVLRIVCIKQREFNFNLQDVFSLLQISMNVL